MKYWWYVFLLFAFMDVNAQQKLKSEKNAIETIGKLLKKSDDFIKVNIDSALYYNKKADEMINQLTEKESSFDVYKNFGNIYLVRGNYAKSVEYYLKANKIAESQLHQDPKNQIFIENQIELLIKLGNVDFQQNNFNEALSFYNKAIIEIEKLGLKASKNTDIFKLKILNNTGSIFLKKNEFKKALDIFIAAKELNVRLKDDVVEPHLLNNIGICYLEEKNYSLAFFYFEQALHLREEQNDQRGIAQCYNNLGKVYALNRKYDVAQEYFDKALAIGKKIGNTESIIYTLNSLSALYEVTNDFKKAFFIDKKINQMKDSMFNEQSVKQIAQLEMKYELDKQKEHYELSIKKEEAEKSKTRMKYYILGACLFFFLAISVLWIYLQKSKIKNIQLSKEKLELEHKNISLEKNTLKEDLEQQDRVMTSKMMYLFKKNELINNIAEQLIALKKSVSSENQKQIQDMIQEMRQKKNGDIWLEFETYFTKVHPDFYLKLQQLFPDLTPNEKKLCAFLRLNMSTKDISAITYQSVNSITVSRSRLRKKLNIQGEDTNLNSFLINL